MKLLLAFILSISISSNCDELDSVRIKYHNIKNEVQLNAFIDELEKDDCNSSVPYLASAIMQRAKYSSWPFKKLKYFKKGKHLLEQFIENHEGNIEARYVRILTQSEIPSFLNYDKHLESDIAFIIGHIETSKISKGYRERILKKIHLISKKNTQ